MVIFHILVYDGFIDQRKSNEIYCTGCIISSAEGSLIFSRSPFEAMEGWVSVVNNTQNIIYIPGGSDPIGMAEYLSSLGGFKGTPIIKPIEEFFPDQAGLYCSELKISGNPISGFSLQLAHIENGKKLIIKSRDVGSLSIVLLSNESSG